MDLFLVRATAHRITPFAGASPAAAEAGPAGRGASPAAAEAGPAGRGASPAAAGTRPAGHAGSRHGLEPFQILAEADGWCRLDRDPRDVGAATRTIACVLRLDDEVLRVTTYSPDGTSAGDDDAPRLAGRPDGTDLMRRARTCRDTGYSPTARLADACRALGVPLALIEPKPARPPSTAQPSPAQPTTMQPSTAQPTTAQPSPAQPTTMQPSPAQPTTAQPTTAQPGPAQPTTTQPGTRPPSTRPPNTKPPNTGPPNTAVSPTGAVLVRAPAATAAADAALTGQSAWTVSLTAGWSLHLWDGAGRPVPPVAAADALALNRPAVACWWSPSLAGFVVVHRRPVAAHEWGGRAPVTPESAARAARVLADDFGVPDQAVNVTALLRRTDRAPADALAELFAVLGLPGFALAIGPEPAAWAAIQPDAVHTERLGMFAAVRRSVREAPVPSAVSIRRPLWYRLVNGVVAVVMALATAGLVLLWRAGEVNGWWVVAGAVAALSYAWGLRPARSRRPSG